MRDKGFSPIFIILIAITLLTIGYFSYKNIFLKQSPITTPSDDTINLVGIWQASGGMAAGWADRYHFYKNGKYHFYPNQMVESNQTDETGSWKIEDDTLILQNKTYKLEPLGTLNNDFYPSVMIGDTQYWQFSTDPTSYGEEKFPAD